MSEKRRFRIVEVSNDDGVEYKSGVYNGRGPGQAAIKAFNQYCRKADLKNCKRGFTLQEITAGSKKKQYHYTGERKKLAKPLEIERNGKTYEIKYESKVHKAE